MDCMFKTLLGTLLGKEVNWEKKSLEHPLIEM